MKFLAATLVLALVCACSNTEAPTEERSVHPQTTSEQNTAETPATTVERTDRLAEESPATYGFTHGDSSGNLIAEGSGDLPNSSPVDVPLDGAPVWVVGVPFRESVAWVVALEEGDVRALYVDGSGRAERLEISPDSLAPGEPPVVEAEGDSLELSVSLNGPGSNLTAPLPLPGPGLATKLLGVQRNGEVFTEVSGFDTTSVDTLPVNAPPDARIVRGEDGRLAVLSSPTRRYEHGVLGDGIEAGSITVFRGYDERALDDPVQITPVSGGVFEEVSPMWVETPGEGELLAVSESADGVGSRISLYSPDAELAAAGPFIGEPFKWRHALAAGPFGPDGEFEIAAVRTPHVDPVVEFYRPDFERGVLDLVAQLPGYTSHRIYTRNLDIPAAGDFDADGNPELLVPNPTYTELAAVRRDRDGAGISWTLPAGGGDLDQHRLRDRRRWTTRGGGR